MCAIVVCITASMYCNVCDSFNAVYQKSYLKCFWIKESSLLISGTRQSLTGKGINSLVSWCGGELWVNQRKKCADICDVAQVTDIRTLPN